MERSVRVSIIVLISLVVSFGANAASIAVGERFPLEKLPPAQVVQSLSAKTEYEKKPADSKLIVFIPSLTEDCEYASMLTQSFYFYFDQRLAFEGSKTSPKTDIYWVVGDKENIPRSRGNIVGFMNFIYDEKGEVFSQFGVKAPTSKNADSTIVLLDKNNKVQLIDEKYRAQGEHLKPLEKKLKEINDIKDIAPAPAKKGSLKTGDTAPDFKVNDEQTLSDLRGNVVLISFYPAAFSGVLPKRSIDIQEAVQSKPLDLMSCAIQLSSINLISQNELNTKRIAVSSSTKTLLQRWRSAIEAYNVEYTNDPDYSISAKYFSYNRAGYNNRVSVIVDQKGKIAYIDENFEAHDEEILNAKIDELIAAEKTGLKH